MNDIVKIKRYLTILNEEYPCHKKDAAMEGAIKLFSTLIAENKELKEEKEYEKELRIKYERRYNLLKESSIKKRKVEELIEKFKPDSKETFIYNQENFVKLVEALQFLLGKE